MIYWPGRVVKAVRRGVRGLVFYLRHGFKRSDTWSLDGSVSRWLVPRLRHFHANHCGYPGGLTEDEWRDILGRMLRAFELRASPEFYDLTYTEVEYAAIREGLDLFAKHFLDLWD